MFFEMHMFARIRKSLGIMLVEENAFGLGKCKIQVLSIKRFFFCLYGIYIFEPAMRQLTVSMNLSSSLRQDRRKQGLLITNGYHH